MPAGAHLRILTFSTCPLDPMLGSGKTRLRWSEGLRALGHDVDVLEPAQFEWGHGWRRGLRFRQALGAVGSARRRVRHHQYDLVEFFGGEFGLATAALARRGRRPFIVAHTDGFELLAQEREQSYAPVGRIAAWYRRHTHDRLSRAAFEHADGFVTGCELDRRRVLEMGLFQPDRTAVVSPGLDEEYLAQDAFADREPRVAYTGSWIARKGIAYLADVMNSVLAQRPRVHLDLHGTGAHPSAIEAFDARVRERVVVHGRQSNTELAGRLSRAGVFFFPTQYEGFGMALAEAMACGCAPVTTATGFGADLRDGQEGLICGFSDTGAMRRAILQLLDDEPFRRRIASAARARVHALYWRTQVAMLEATYREWLADAPAGLASPHAR